VYGPYNYADLTDCKKNVNTSNKQSHLNRRIDRLVKSSNPREVQAIYREWAADYDADLLALGYIAPQRCCDLLAALVPNKRALIYDAGCGTGQVGKILNSMGYSRLYGADFSAQMLAQAKMTGAYAQLNHADYSRTLEIEDESYDAIISVGVYTARFDGFFIPEMLRCLQSDGVFVFTCREQYFENEVHSALERCVERGEIYGVKISLEQYILGHQSQAYYIAMSKSHCACAQK